MLFAYKENIKSFCLKIFTKLGKIGTGTLKTLADSFDTEICVKGVKTRGEIKLFFFFFLQQIANGFTMHTTFMNR